MRARAVALAVAIVLAPLGAQSADLVVWWEQGFNPEEDAAVREVVAAFEQKTGKQVELDLPPHDDIEARIVAAVSAGQPPDFLFGFNTDYYYGQWANEDRLIDLSDVIGPFASLFDPDALRYATLLDGTTGRRAIYALPMPSSIAWSTTPTRSSSRATACASCERTSSHDHRHRRQPAPVGPQAPPTSLAPPAVWEGLPPGSRGPPMDYRDEHPTA